MQNNALEKRNPNNTATTMGLQIAGTVQEGNHAVVLESSLPTFAQSSAAAKNANQVLEELGKEQRIKDQT